MWLILILSLFLTKPAIAQDAEFTQFKNDYTFQYNTYLESYKKYLEKKDIYTKYGTVSTESDKLAAAKTAINDRNTALKSYLQALRVFLNKYKNNDVANTEKLQIELQNWENWLVEQLSIVPNINNSADLSKWVDDFKQKYIDIQQSIYSALVYNQINQKKSILSLITTLSDSIKTDPNIKPENQAWTSNLTIKIDLANASLEQAADLTTKKSYQSRFTNFYPDAKNSLQSAHNYFRELFNDLKIIIIKSSPVYGNESN